MSADTANAVMSRLCAIILEYDVLEQKLPVAKAASARLRLGCCSSQALFTAASEPSMCTVHAGTLSSTRLCGWRAATRPPSNLT